MNQILFSSSQAHNKRYINESAYCGSRTDFDNCILKTIDIYSYWVKHVLICNHRYQKAKIDCLSFVMCLLLTQPIIAFFSSFLVRPFTLLMKQTRQAVRAVKQSIILRCLWCWQCILNTNAGKPTDLSCHRCLINTGIEKMNYI